MRNRPTVALLMAGATLLAAGTASSQGKAKPKPPASPAPTAGPTVDALALKALKARSIGPAVMGGRVADIALDPKDPYTFYVALGTGGLMKTADNGGTFDAVFEKEAVAAVGDRFIVETDAPFLPPQSARGSENKPANVVEVLRSIAGIRGVNLDQMVELTTRTALETFPLIG